jgi:hypothetical protein
VVRVISGIRRVRYWIERLVRFTFLNNNVAYARTPTYQCHVLMSSLYAQYQIGSLSLDTVSNKWGINCANVLRLFLHRVLSVHLDPLLHTLIALDAQSDDFYVPALHID